MSVRLSALYDKRIQKVNIRKQKKVERTPLLNFSRNNLYFLSLIKNNKTGPIISICVTRRYQFVLSFLQSIPSFFT